MSVGSQRRNTGPDETTRNLVYARDRGCVICGETYDLQIHHRAPRKMGGTRRPEINSPANLLLLCADCHRFVETNRELCLDRGLLVSSWQTPSEVALMWHGDWFTLTDDGRAVPALDERHP